jgi:hypothetical protein
MRDKLREWQHVLYIHRYALGISAIFLILANVINMIAGQYTAEVGNTVVPDLVLDFLPVIDLSFFYAYGFFFITLALLLYPFFFDVDKLHVTIGQFSLLILVRSFFILLTHLKTPIEAVAVNAPSIFILMDSENALFFSGHTSVPFLGMLLFRRKWIRRFFLVSTVFMAMTVLLMHEHYSIDVFAALFITYCSYRIGKLLLSLY